MLLGAVLGAALMGLGPIADGDIYWHLAAGNEILRGRALLRTDPFTVSAGGRPWVDLHWLFQVVVATVNGWGGLTALAWGKAIAVAAGVGLLVGTAGRRGGHAAREVCSVTAVGLLFLVRHLLPLRPVIVSLSMIALFLWVLEGHRAGQGRRWLWALPFLQIIWVNCQGLSPLGPALLGAYVVGAALEARLGRRGGVTFRSAVSRATPLGALTIAFGLTVVASLVTPYGLDAVVLPWRLLARLAPGQHNVFGAAIAENVPPFVLERTAPAGIAHFKWVLAGFALAVALLRPRVPVAHATILLVFAGLALMANRNVLLFYWVAAPLGAIALGPRAAERWRAWRDGTATYSPSSRLAAGPAAPISARSDFIHGLLGALPVLAALGGELALGAFALAGEAPVGAPTPFHFPVESARLLARTEARGPVFAPDQHGGYLTFAVPGLRPYIDTRLILHTAAEYEAYLGLFDDPARFDALDRVHGFRYVVLTTAYPDRYVGLIAHLAADPTWRLRYTDGYEVLFAREGSALDLASPGTVAAIDASLVDRHGPRPAVLATARLHLARTLIAMGRGAAAERVLATEGSRAAAELRARGYFAAGAFAAAESLTRVLLLQDEADPRSLTLMAELALGQGRPDEARRWLAQALRVAPYDPEARAVLAHGLEDSAAAPPSR